MYKAQNLVLHPWVYVAKMENVYVKCRGQRSLTEFKGAFPHHCLQISTGGGKVGSPNIVKSTAYMKDALRRRLPCFFWRFNKSKSELT